MNLDLLEQTMQRERMTAIRKHYENGKPIEKDSCFFLRAISKDELMVGMEKESEAEARKLARDYWLKGFLYVEVFCWRNKKLDVVYHGVRWGF